MSVKQGAWGTQYKISEVYLKITQFTYFSLGTPDQTILLSEVNIMYSIYFLSLSDTTNIINFGSLIFASAFNAELSHTFLHKKVCHRKCAICFSHVVQTHVLRHLLSCVQKCAILLWFISPF